MKTLAIDTSTQALSVALRDGDQVVTETTTNTKIKHSTQLLPLIDNMFKLVGWQTSDLEGIVVTEGPGSYTGLRIGVTAAKTLANTLSIPLFTLPTLMALAGNVQAANGPALVIPFIDARRKTAFATAYLREGGSFKALFNTSHGLFTDFLDQLETYLNDHPDLQQLSLNFISPDIDNFRADIEAKFGDQATIFPNEFGLIHAGHLGALPLRQVDVDTFIPDYAKLSEAEENWVAQNPEEAKADEGTYVERTN
ncbi:tRNA (adenosine(37)-N6)-threonylcarbamoyltransferase complex dimerization subunit type 1 TsaB [Aerococcaceae bacterium 50-4]